MTIARSSTNLMIHVPMCIYDYIGMCVYIVTIVTNMYRKISMNSNL